MPTGFNPFFIDAMREHYQHRITHCTDKQEASFLRLQYHYYTGLSNQVKNP